MKSSKTRISKGKANYFKPFQNSRRSDQSRRVYNPANYHPAYTPNSMADKHHTATSPLMYFWTAIGWFYAALVTWHLDIILPSLSQASLLCATAFFVLLCGCWAGLVTHMMPNLLLRFLRRRFAKKDPKNGLLLADYTHSNLQLPISMVWSLVFVAASGIVLWEMNPQAAVEKVFQQPNQAFSISEDITPLMVFLENAFNFMLLSPLIAGNALGAIPKDPVPEDMPEELALHLEAQLEADAAERSLKKTSYGYANHSTSPMRDKTPEHTNPATKLHNPPKGQEPKAETDPSFLAMLELARRIQNQNPKHT
jgi:hypothetical protein